MNAEIRRRLAALQVERRKLQKGKRAAHREWSRAYEVWKLEPTEDHQLDVRRAAGEYLVLEGHLSVVNGRIATVERALIDAVRKKRTYRQFEINA